MAVLTIYKIDTYNESYKKIFFGVYNDFAACARTDYNFELEPLNYDKFINALENGLLSCLILFEDNIPTGFLVYTDVISESLELNIIHCIGNENINEKRTLLLERFMEINKHIIREKTVTYPLLGKQSSFVEDITKFGFKTVNTSVMVFDFSDITSINKLNGLTFNALPKGYSLSDWKNAYSKNAAEIIFQSFKHSSDRLFDPRFASLKGCKDIVQKITESIYGEFLPDVTKVLLYKNKPVGVCFANMTNDKIANIPVIGILKHHRNSRFGEMLLKSATEDLMRTLIQNGITVTELNASCDSDNFPATSMYNAVGFRPGYIYAQAYHPKA